jgi:RimJ/RimL family protein N-acetyltransferase
MNVRVRPSVEADADAIARWFPNERSLVQWGGPHVRHPFDRTQLARLLEEGLSSPPGRLCFTGEDERGSPVGHFQLVFDWPSETARLGRVGVAPQLRQKGVGLALVRHAAETAFAITDIHRLELVVYTFNEPARRLYARAGFVYEGTQRETTPVAFERWSIHMMSLLRPEWQEIAAPCGISGAQPASSRTVS